MVINYRNQSGRLVNEVRAVGAGDAALPQPYVAGSDPAGDTKPEPQSGPQLTIGGAERGTRLEPGSPESTLTHGSAASSKIESSRQGEGIRAAPHVVKWGLPRSSCVDGSRVGQGGLMRFAGFAPTRGDHGRGALMPAPWLPTAMSKNYSLSVVSTWTT